MVYNFQICDNHLGSIIQSQKIILLNTYEALILNQVLIRGYRFNSKLMFSVAWEITGKFCTK